MNLINELWNTRVVTSRVRKKKEKNWLHVWISSSTPSHIGDLCFQLLACQHHRHSRHPTAPRSDRKPATDRRVLHLCNWCQSLLVNRIVRDGASNHRGRKVSWLHSFPRQCECFSFLPAEEGLDWQAGCFSATAPSQTPSDLHLKNPPGFTPAEPKASTVFPSLPHMASLSSPLSVHHFQYLFWFSCQPMMPIKRLTSQKQPIDQNVGTHDTCDFV